MRFRLFGGLDCPDAVLAQLSILANSDVLTPKAVATLTEHVVNQLLIDFSQRSLASKSHGTAPPTATGLKKALTERQQLQADRQRAIQGLFSDVCAPYLAVLSGDEPSADVSALDDFATKLVSHTLETRKLRALQAEAAARKFVVAAGTAAGESAVEESGEYDPNQALISPDFAEKALRMVVDGLSQVLVCIGTLLENASRFLLSNETFSTELTMLGVNPQTAEAIVEAMSAAVSVVDLAEVKYDLEPLGADGAGLGVRTLYALMSQSSVAHNQPSHIRVEPIARASLQTAIGDAVSEVLGEATDPAANTRPRKITASKSVLTSHVETGEFEEGTKRFSHRIHWSFSQPASGSHMFSEITKEGAVPTSVEVTHQQATSLLAELMLARELLA